MFFQKILTPIQTNKIKTTSTKLDQFISIVRFGLRLVNVSIFQLSWTHEKILLPLGIDQILTHILGGYVKRYSGDILIALGRNDQIAAMGKDMKTYL